MRKTNHATKIANIIRTLGASHPEQSIATHIFIALEEYESLNNLTDKEFLYQLEKYKTLKELDLSIPHSRDIQKIIEDGMNLDSILADEEDDF